MQIQITLISNYISNKALSYCKKKKGGKREGVEQVQIRWVSREFWNSLNGCWSLDYLKYISQLQPNLTEWKNLVWTCILIVLSS